MVVQNWIEGAVILFIIGVMGFLTWRGGAANPVGTGGLDKRMTSLSAEIKAVDSEVKGVVSKVGEIEDRLEDMEKISAKVADIKRVERRMEAHDHKMDAVLADVAKLRTDSAAQAVQAAHTAKQVDMLYQHIVAKGMGS